MSSSRLEHVERLENREKSENEEPWQEPYDLRENLTGSVICLDKTLNTLRNINSTLGSTIDHFKGQSKLTRYTRVKHFNDLLAFLLYISHTQLIAFRAFYANRCRFCPSSHCTQYSRRN